TGMTCTSCSGRAERKLNKLDGVDATVNFATESASISFDPSKLDTDALIETVRGAGYDAFTMKNDDDQAVDATSAGGGAGPRDQAEEARARETPDLKHRLVVSAAPAVPVVLVGMIPALQFTHWQWAVLPLATPILCWGGAPFPKATLANL